jgi:hypothetical protein
MTNENRFGANGTRLLKVGFSTQDLIKFLGGHFMRVFHTVWKPGDFP